MNGVAVKNAASMTFRVVAIVVGGIALAAGSAALSGILLTVLGAPLGDAMVAMALAGYVFYGLIVMWGFADRRTLRRPFAVLGGGVLTMSMASVLAPGVLGP